MLVSHPNIITARLREDIGSKGKVTQTLVVETDLKLPRSNSYADTTREFESLVDYLTSLAESDFNHFSKVEIRAPKIVKHQNDERALFNAQMAAANNYSASEAHKDR